ncbi:MAG: NAD(P)(+) transhydrogenase (Re/Si-specific) subunit beta, partial [Gemmatimonadetes bacterium]|nr:NAD(P)(+) transhydrogenase (Re/Si-specific) subunit beta [Gemmatimonadota bacterium]
METHSVLPEFFLELGWINLAYLVASILFIMGIKGLTHPRTAVRGNALGALGMLVAVVATFLAKGLAFPYILAAIAVGSLIGAVAAARVPMTAMPEMVALFNGFGGAASTLVAASVILENGSHLTMQPLVATGASGLIGTVTLTGSVIAYLKLAEKMKSGAIHFPAQQAFNALIALVAVACGVWVVMQPDNATAYWALCVVSGLLGVLLTIPIGGADMPVVIALLNSYSGLAAAATGFVLDNNVLIISGSLVGASGIILTSIMCKAMNRSLTNVLFGTLGPSAGSATADEVYGGKVKATSPDEVAMLMDGAQRVVVVPGYGMA